MNGESKSHPGESSVAHSGGGIVVRKCGMLEEFHACVELQREIWAEADLEIEPVTMFVVASITGGQVLGAFDGDKLVGYTLAVVGLRQGAIDLDPHQTGVSAQYRGAGGDCDACGARSVEARRFAAGAGGANTGARGVHEVVRARICGGCGAGWREEQ